MNAVETLKAARSAGIWLRIDGDHLALEAPTPPPGVIVDLLSRHKDDILALLRPGADGWSREDWIAHYEERAGLAEFDAAYTRIDAELIAFEDCIVHWLALNPPKAQSPDNCLHCRLVISGDCIEVPKIDAQNEGVGRLHVGCASRFDQIRRASARTALGFLLGTDNAP